MSTADERWCSACLRWFRVVSKVSRYLGWTTDADGAWVCPGCSPKRGTVER